MTDVTDRGVMSNDVSASSTVWGTVDGREVRLRPVEVYASIFFGVVESVYNGAGGMIKTLI